MEWKDFFNSQRELPYYQNLHEKVLQEYNCKIVYPPLNLIYNAFKLTPFNDVKVVIMGQDPYHNPHQAMGLAFSVPENEMLPPSLKNIFKEIENEYHVKMKNNGDLTANFMKHALSDTDFDKIANYVKKLIIETSIKIRNGEFPISPIKLSNEESACSTCNMKKICYMTPKNIRVFVKNANLDYILKEGGLNNEME